MEATIVPFLDAQGRAEPVRRTARTDVTALKEIEASTRALVENVFRPDFVIEDLNPAAERIFGYRREELGGRDRLIQVVVNLLSNAIKFSPPGSRVRVEARRAGDDVGVSVSDEGRGVPPALREAICEPFRQVESDDARLKGGTGLGLAICRAIVEQHGGASGVEAQREGPGAVFWFTLPAADPGTP